MGSRHRRPRNVPSTPGAPDISDFHVPDSAEHKNAMGKSGGILGALKKRKKAPDSSGDSNKRGSIAGAVSALSGKPPT